MNDWNEKKLGFGLMRLPKKEGQIDLEQVCSMADAFLDRGFSYFDTAYAYPGSEEAFRKAVVERHPRDRFTVATKLSIWPLGDELTPEQEFQIQLQRTGAGYFDYYLLHNLQPAHYETIERFRIWDFVREKKAQGLIRHLGFSFHRTPEVLDEILSAHPEVDFVQLQINYIDWESRDVQSRALYEMAHEKHGKDVVVMEPVKGGQLASLRPEHEALFRALDPAASVPSYALRFVGSLPGVKMILSGMGSMEQMQDNLGSFDPFRPLSQQERETVNKLVDGLRAVPTVPCTAGRYCTEGCPQKINIPEIFKAYNRVLTYGEQPGAHAAYRQLLSEGSGAAESCIACGQCEGACPQRIPVITRMAEAAGVFDR